MEHTLESIYCLFVLIRSQFRFLIGICLTLCLPSNSGLILQDLTFVHIGNNDYLPDGNINFGKRWQQYNILDQMRRFRNWYRSYSIVCSCQPLHCLVKQLLFSGWIEISFIILWVGYTRGALGNFLKSLKFYEFIS